MKTVKLKLFLLCLMSLIFVSTQLFASSTKGKETEKSKGPVTLRFWLLTQSPKVDEYTQNSIAKFESEYPDIKVDFEVIPYAQYRDKLLVSIEGGTEPDVFLIDHIWGAEFAESGSIIPLDSYLAEYNIKKQDFFPAAWQANVWKGKVWGVPSDIGFWSFTFYNKDMFRAAGLDPENPPILDTNDFIKTCKKLTKPEKEQWALAISGGIDESTVCITDSFIYSFGGSVISDDGKTCVLNSPEAIEGLKYYASLEKYSPKGVAAFGQESTIELFKTKRAAMFWFPGELGQDNVSDVDFDWGIAVTPAPRGKRPIGTSGGWSMVISKNSPYVKEALTFITFMASARINAGVTSLTPANIEASKELRKTKIKADLIIEQTKYARPRPVSPVYPRISEIQQYMLQNIFTGASLKEEVEKATKDIQELLNEYH
jgi:ABC-type glycerol-3-phosphate transport system substrate-binding protein